MKSYRNLLKIAGLFFIISLLSSCTVLQWRETDEEIMKRHRKLNIPAQISYFEVDSLDLNIRVLEVSEQDKEINLLFFHGSPSSLSAWNGYMTDSLLMEKANLYTVDRPGYGYSNFGDEMTSIDLQAQLMSALISERKWENVIAIGSSYGGPLAARLAILNPDVKAVMMISPAIDPKNEKDIWASRLTQWWITRWMVPTGYRVAGDEKTVHAQELARLEKDWAILNIPVVHIHGDIDDIVPYENVHYTKKVFPNIEIITTKETGHEIAWARKDLILPHLVKLIEKVEGEK
ncbi:alpha/beta hydrolase [Aureisphaera galaxeae]|uniref:alpha/beta fold hydrolase n=1 Tax=Aureisphaera galaxeae TaxID=1538023 RepID=UPI002350A0F4|nr:alpha/beta hydrolase [Aureisphaera galaxeae]MDC8005247.1 alpha/beta hydrolase [Aureisphaera galaxeae]